MRGEDAAVVVATAAAVLRPLHGGARVRGRGADDGGRRRRGREAGVGVPRREAAAGEGLRGPGAEGVDVRAGDGEEAFVGGGAAECGGCGGFFGAGGAVEAVEVVGGFFGDAEVAEGGGGSVAPVGEIVGGAAAASGDGGSGGRRGLQLEGCGGGEVAIRRFWNPEPVSR